MADVEVSVINSKAATVSVTRKVSPKQYESLEVGAFIPVELPERLDTDTDESYRAAIGAAISAMVNIAKVQVYDQLGISYTDENGVISEKVAAAFAGSSINNAPPPAPTVTGAAAAVAASNGNVSCPKCKGAMWDNRVGKKNPKAPDHKCKSPSCDGVVWPPRGK